jgi:four helix bundle protein
MGTLNSFRDLRVYQELKRLHLELNTASLGFPKFEMYELGSQMRRSSNSAPAILAEGWGSRHTNIYIEAINRSKGEIRETQHHLDVARAKGYLDGKRWEELDTAYESCDRMLERLHQRLSEWNGSTRTGYEVREPPASYDAFPQGGPWAKAVTITEQVLLEFPPLPPTSYPQPSTLHPQPSTLHPPPSTLNPQPSTLHPPPSTLHPPPPP